MDALAKLISQCSPEMIPLILIFMGLVFVIYWLVKIIMLLLKDRDRVGKCVEDMVATQNKLAESQQKIVAFLHKIAKDGEFND